MPALRHLAAAIAAALLLAAAPALAQDRGHAGHALGIIERLADTLELSDAQRADLLALRDESRAKLERLRAEGAEREAMRAELRDARERMLDLLTDEQRGTLAELRERRRADRPDPAQRRALREALAAYRRDEIVPTLRELRADFDEHLTEAERADVARLRSAVREGLAERPAARGERPLAREERREATRDFLREHREELSAVRAVASAHESELTAVKTELRRLRESWRAETDELRTRYLGEAARERPARLHRHAGPRRDSLRDEGAGRPGRDRGALMFLLLDPADPEATDFDGLGDTAPQAFPNPADAETTVTFAVRAPGSVTVELIDASGRLIRTVDRGPREVGEVTLPVDLPGDVGPTALVRVTDAQGPRTIVVTRR